VPQFEQSDRAPRRRVCGSKWGGGEHGSACRGGGSSSDLCNDTGLCIAPQLPRRARDVNVLEENNAGGSFAGSPEHLSQSLLSFPSPSLIHIIRMDCHDDDVELGSQRPYKKGFS